MDLERFIAFCGEQELDGVDLMSPVFYEWSWKDPHKELKSVNGWIERAGLKLAAYAAGNNFAKGNAAEFDAQVAQVRQCLREAADLGAPVLRIFGGHLEKVGGEVGITSATGLRKVLAGIERCLPEAEKTGVVMAIENHGGLPAHSFEIVAIVKHFDSPYVRCTADCGNFVGHSMDEPENPLDAVKRLAPWIRHVHMKDVRKPLLNKTRRMEACVTGEGVVPIRQCAAVLEEIGFAGYCSLEYEAHAVMPVEEGVPRSLAVLREVRAVLNVLAAERV